MLRSISRIASTENGRSPRGDKIIAYGAVRGRPSLLIFEGSTELVTIVLATAAAATVVVVAVDQPRLALPSRLGHERAP